MTDHRQGPGDAVVKCILWALSLVYGLGVRVMRSLYTAKVLPVYRASKPVISVGNITVGGSGKTPLVIAIVHALVAKGLRPAILTRGYMPRSARAVESDEVRMLRESLPGIPVLAGADRRRSIEEGLKHHAVDVFVCDDAFQHWPLHRDLDVVAVDASNPFGNGCLLPRGILREPVDALKRAQVIVLTKADQANMNLEHLQPHLKEINAQALIVHARYAVTGCRDVYAQSNYDLAHLKGLRLAVFCAIGDPASFRRLLEEAGLDVANIFVFMDHHVYTPQDMDMVRRWMQDNHVQAAITTHKDAVKLGGFANIWQGLKVYCVQVEPDIIHGKNLFSERIVSAGRH